MISRYAIHDVSARCRSVHNFFEEYKQQTTICATEQHRSVTPSTEGTTDKEQVHTIQTKLNRQCSDIPFMQSIDISHNQ